MHSIFLLPKLLGEAELLVIERKHIMTMKGILNDSVASDILDFLEQVELLGIDKATDQISLRISSVADIVKEVLYDRCKGLTFYKEVEKKEMFKMLWSLNMKTAIDIINETDTNELESNLKWLLANEENWVSSINTRSKEAYLEFEAACYDIQQKADTYKNVIEYNNPNLKVEPVVNIRKRLSNPENRNYFYSYNEKKRNTGLGSLTKGSKREDLIEILHGIEYKRECENCKIPDYMRRGF